MRNIVDPQQNRLFDPFHGLISEIGRKVINNGWQAVFRHLILILMPVCELGRHFDPTVGAPTKELYSMAGLVFLADFHGWTAQEAAEAYMFRVDVQYALNLEPGAEVSSRTVERYQQIFREDDLPSKVFDHVTKRLVDLLDLDVKRQRLDSTHVSSHMATFGRTKLMAVAIKRFLTQVKRKTPDLYEALPEELRVRYEPSASRLFADAKSDPDRKRLRQQAAEDLLRVVDHFAANEQLTNCSTYKALVKIFGEQCELIEGKVTVREKTGGDVIQNPSDPDATLDGHKGAGYQVQIAETCGENNEVQLITAALPQTACEHDSSAVAPILEQLRTADLTPEELLADTAYGGDENVLTAEAGGVELIAPVPGRDPVTEPDALTIDDFAMDEKTGSVERCPAGNEPVSSERDDEKGMTTTEMPAEKCRECQFRKQCPIKKTREGRYIIESTDKERRITERRREQQTDVFKERYSTRSGIESTNSGLKNRLGMKRLRVRGRGSVYRVILHKLAGWNMLRAAASEKMRALIAERVAKTMGGRENGLIGLFFDRVMSFLATRSGPTTRFWIQNRGRSFFFAV